MIVWALFDSGNGCYKKASEQFNDIELYSIGIDRENKNSHFINLDLADYKRIFKDNTLFETLDKLPKPDLIIASPPCESWSNASNMKNGNACWKVDTIETLVGTFSGGGYCIREYQDYINTQFYYDRQLLTRINGELCIFNTIEIIKKYNPKYYIIENPAYGRIWDYINRVLGFKIPYENLTFYNNYGFEIKKPEKFASNILLNLNCLNHKANVDFRFMKGDYNKRSDIPQELIVEIFNKIKNKMEV